MRNIDAALLDYTKWAEVDMQNLQPKERDNYTQRKSAIIARIDGASLGACCSKFTISKREIWRYIKRCTSTHSDGRPYGFRALTPHAHITKASIVKLTQKRERKGERDSFRMLVEKFPHIFSDINSRFLKRIIGKVIHESRTPIKSLHTRMLNMLRDAGVRASEYPFNVSSRGIRSMTRYLNNVAEQNGLEAARARYHEDVARRLSLDKGRPQVRQKLTPYQRVTADGHRLDLMMAVEVLTPDGEIALMTIDRLWVFILMDEASRAVIGYSLSLNPEYTQDDVLRAIRSALIPWKPRDLKIKGMRYADGAGLPNGVIPELAHAIWEEFSVDNAKSNLSLLVKNRMHELIGCAINAGPINMPERRGIIERFFRTLEESGIHRLPSTTGSNPKDGRRNNPEKKAIRHKIMLDDIEELLDVLIANYNATPNSGALNGISPNEYLCRFIANNGIVLALPEEKIKSFNFMQIRERRTIKGGISKGRSPHINYEGVVYTNDLLKHSYSLVGAKVTLHVNIEDLRQIKIFLEDGAELGILTAHGSWGVTPHDLKTRKAINRLKWQGKLASLDIPDATAAFVDNLEEKVARRVKKRKISGGAALTKLEQIKRIKARATPTEIISREIHNNDSNVSSLNENNQESHSHKDVVKKNNLPPPAFIY